MKTDKEKLRVWKKRLSDNDTAYAGETALMDRREALYRGDRTVKPLTALDKEDNGSYHEAVHVRNIVAENVESEVDSNIPQPKVTAMRQQDEKLAKIIEDMIRNELDRMPFETLNDQQERTVPIQGGGYMLVEWDNTLRTHTTVGEVAVSLIHPKQTVPQNGIFSGIEDMDYFILKLPQTKMYIKRRYGVDVSEESESEPEIKAAEEKSPADDLVVQYVAFYRNDDGGVGRYSWVNDVQLEDLEDYQARRLRRCAKCGALEPSDVEPMDMPSVDGTYPGNYVRNPLGEHGGYPGGTGSLPEDAGGAEATPSPQRRSASSCPYCGSTKYEESEEEYEELYTPRNTASGKVIPGAEPALDQNGAPYLRPTIIPYYKPNEIPIVLQKNVSVFGKLLGDSDVDKIADQQNTTNRISKKIIDRIIAAGTMITLPDKADIRIDPKDGKKIYLKDAAQKNMIDVYDFTGDLEYELVYRQQVYEEARQHLGITNSLQGREDDTAQSGVAKQFAAAQSAGRLESKRVMKNAAYARLFELIFKFRLAYADEPRPVISKDDKGNNKYDQFDRFDFLEQDAAGEWYWNDRFLFSCDSSAPLANNRQAMWQETTAHLQAGAFGDPTQLETLILYWTKMELLHYPGASDTKTYLEEKLQEQKQAAILAQQLTPTLSPGESTPAGQSQAESQAAQMAQQDVMNAVDEQARQDAQAAAQSGSAS